MSTTNYQQSSAAATTSNTKIFKKSFLAQYGILFALIPLDILMLLGGFTSPVYRTAFLLSGIAGVLLLLIPFLQVGRVRVEPNKLTVETFFEQKVFNAREIKEIKMQSVRGRYGRVTNFVNIIPVKGTNYPLANFTDKAEVIHDFLMKWWEYYRNQ